jgi:hypothetical protein
MLNGQGYARALVVVMGIRSLGYRPLPVARLIQ